MSGGWRTSEPALEVRYDGRTRVTYAGFLALFLLIPVALVRWRYRREARDVGARPIWAILIVVYVAAIPWDFAAVKSGLWSFGAGKTMGLTVIGIPLEEYAFFGLQGLLVAWAALGRLTRVMRREAAP
jgi:lycopene cyclase domain-containing protein